MTYHYQPQQEYELTKLERILKELQYIIEREKKRHMMDEHLTHSMRDLLEYEIIPLLEAEVYYDPTPQYWSMKKELISRQQADRAINQMFSVIVGKRQAVASHHLQNYNPERLEFSLTLIRPDMENDINLGDPDMVVAALVRSQRTLTSVQ